MSNNIQRIGNNSPNNGIKKNNNIQRIGNANNNYNIEKIRKQVKNIVSATINQMPNKDVMNYVSNLNENELAVLKGNVSGGSKKPKSKKSPAKKPKSKKSPAKKPKRKSLTKK